MLNETNFMRFLSVSLVVQVSCDWFENSSVFGRGISKPMVMSTLFDDEILRGFIGIVTDGGGEVTGGKHFPTQCMPFRGSLVIIFLLKEFSHPRVHTQSSPSILRRSNSL